MKSTVRDCLWDYTISEAELQFIITGSDRYSLSEYKTKE